MIPEKDVSKLLETGTKQEIFDFVLNHLRIQNNQAYEEGCKYRTDTGETCAIGCLIPDNAYSSAYEGHSIMYIEPSPIGIARKRIGITLFAELQFFHDTPRYWKAKKNPSIIFNNPFSKKGISALNSIATVHKVSLPKWLHEKTEEDEQYNAGHQSEDH